MKAEQTKGKKPTADTFGISKLLSVQRRHKRLKTLVDPALSEYEHVEYDRCWEVEAVYNRLEKSVSVTHCLADEGSG
jgi:thymidylate kinase